MEVLNNLLKYIGTDSHKNPSESSPTAVSSFRNSLNFDIRTQQSILDIIKNCKIIFFLWKKNEILLWSS